MKNIIFACIVGLASTTAIIGPAMAVQSDAHTEYCRTNSADPICVKRHMQDNSSSGMFEMSPLLGTSSHTRYCRDATYDDSICMNSGAGY
jgi:hypothetical protein